MSATINKPVDWLAETEFEFNRTEIDNNNDVAVLYLGRNWERNVAKFFEDLANLRSRYNNLNK